MAEVKLDFTAQTEELRAGLQQTRDLLVQIQDAQKANNQAIQQDATKNVQAAEKFNSTLESSLAITSQLGKQGLGDLKKGLDNATQSAENFEEAGTSAGDALDSTFKSLVAEATKAAKAQGVVVQQIDKGKAASIDLLKNIGAISAEEAQLAKEATAVLDSFHQQAKAGDPIVKNAVSLRTQVKLAREELDRLVEASNGKITPELAAAAQKAGLLQDRMEDLAALTTAFNPDKKFQAFANVLGNVANGFQAATAAAGLFGDQSEDLTRALLKIQQTVAFVQGLQGFLGGLSDNLKNIKTLIVATSAATQASAVATTEDATAKAADAVATDAAAVSNVGFAASIKAVTLSLLASPLLPILVLLGVLVGIVVELTSKTTDYNKAVEDLNKSLDETTQKQIERIDQDLALKNILAEREALLAGDTEAARRHKDEIDYQNKRFALVQKQTEYQLNVLDLISQKQRVVDAGGPQTAIDAATDKLIEYQNKSKEVDAELSLLEAQHTNDIISNTNAQAKAFADLAKRRVAIQEKLNADLIALNDDLQKRLAQREFDNATPEQQLAIERRTAQKELDVQRDKILQSIALIQLQKNIGVEAFESLTEAQKKAQAEALVNSGAVKLAVEQDQQFTTLSLGVWEDYWKKRVDLDTKNQQTLLTLNTDTQAKERAQLEMDLMARAAALREAGATEQQILDDAAAKRAALLETQSQKIIDLNERIALAQVDQRERGAQSEVDFERQKQQAILGIKIKAAEDSLALIAASADREDVARAEELRALIAKLKAEAAAVTPAPFDLFKLLGFTFDAKEKAAIESAIKDVVSLANAAINAQAIQVQAQINATDAIIADRERRSQDLQSRLANEIALAEAGYANNIDLIRQQIAANDAAEAADKARRADLLADQKRIAREQLAIDSLVQASSLITATAQLFSSQAPKGIVGIATAIGLIATMVAAFLSIKAKANAINQAPSFGEGDWINGPSHKRGGVPIVAEGGEFMVRKREARKFPKVLEGINENDWTKERQRALVELMDSAGVKLSLDEADKFVAVKREFVSHSTINNSIDNTRLERKVERLTNEVIALRGDGRNKPGTSVVNGKVITVKPGRTVRNG